jgi:hypothetical protein
MALDHFGQIPAGNDPSFLPVLRRQAHLFRSLIKRALLALPIFRCGKKSLKKPENIDFSRLFIVPIVLKEV